MLSILHRILSHGGEPVRYGRAEVLLRLRFTLAD
jgi:hypothetical protein